MINVVITGGNGFLGREIIDYFSDCKAIRVIPTDRRKLDPTSYESTKNFFKTEKVDFVIHTAVKGGKRGHIESVEDLFDNIHMVENLLKFKHQYKALFNFCSGAAFDRKANIVQAKEEEILTSLPADYYGLSKNLISRKSQGSERGIYNLRLFGCFGKYEESQRFIKNSITNLLKGGSIEIHQDKDMDFFYSEDVCKVIEYLMENNDSGNIDKDYNLCYKKKYRLSDIAKVILDVVGLSDRNVIIHHDGMSNSYTGDSSRLEKLKIDFVGLEEGIRRCHENWNKS